MEDAQKFAALEKAITQSAEQLIFQDLLQVRQEELHLAFSSDDYQVVVDILEPFQARLFLFFSKDFARQLVTEMLGEPISQDEQVMDGLNELGNTIAGQFMANHIQEKRFSIGLPQCKTGLASAAAPFDRIFTFYFDETRIGAFLQEQIDPIQEKFSSQKEI